MTNNFIIKKTILVFIALFGVAAFLYLTTSIPNHIASDSYEPVTFRFEIKGHEGAKIYAEFVIDDETRKVTETLPTTLTYEANLVDFKVVSLDTENQEPFSFEAFRNNESVLSKQGKSVYGSLEFKESHHNKLSRSMINSMSDEDIQSFIASRSQ
ncbi:hypothetical protein K8I31_14445 [bacterium]|nr:hypothetical protein [bacterium]